MLEVVFPLGLRYGGLVILEESLREADAELGLGAAWGEMGLYPRRGWVGCLYLCPSVCLSTLRVWLCPSLPCLSTISRLSAAVTSCGRMSCWGARHLEPHKDGCSIRSVAYHWPEWAQPSGKVLLRGTKNTTRKKINHNQVAHLVQKHASALPPPPPLPHKERTCLVC